MAQLIQAAVAPHLYEFVERCKTEMPGDYLPGAAGVIFPGKEVLSAAGYVAGSNRPRGWSQLWPGNYRKCVGKHVLMVRQCGGPRSEHWSVERIDLDDTRSTEALVFRFGPAPIFCRSRQAAMRLAEHCYPDVQLPMGLCWMEARRRP